MILLSSNNANSTLAAGITSGQTSIQLATGTGALFPSPGANQYFPITFNDVSTGLVYEIAWCTSRTGDSLTVIRGQEGTSARAWLLGDYAYNANTAGNIQTGRAFSAVNNPTLPFTIPATHNGVSQVCASTGTITLPASSGIADGFICPIVCSAAGGVITVNTNSALAALPNGNTFTTFTLNGAGVGIVLQWNNVDSKWSTIMASAPFYSYVKPYYLVNQSGSITANPNTSYSILVSGITMPAFSKTGAFRIRVNLISNIKRFYQQRHRVSEFHQQRDGWDKYTSGRFLVKHRGGFSWPSVRFR